jgi:hypothetical protein
VALFLLASAAIALVLSAYGEDDPRRILRGTGRRFVAFVVGTSVLVAVMWTLETFVLAPR